jgi:hypothetical protein
MIDKKDVTTFDLFGFEAAAAPDLIAPEPAVKQEQLPLLEETDASGLPVWRRDDKLDLTGLPVWAPA